MALSESRSKFADGSRLTIKFPSEEELERSVAVAERSQHVPSSQPSGTGSQQQGATQEVPGHGAPHVYTEEVDRAKQLLRAVVTEVALFSETLRYRWGTMRRVFHVLIDEALADYLRHEEDDETKLIVGPDVSGQGTSQRLSVADTEDETAEIVCHPQDIDRAREEIHELLEGFHQGAPFTVQRLSELVLEPGKQYANLDKYLNALTVVLSVTSLHVGVERRTSRAPGRRPPLS